MIRKLLLVFVFSISSIATADWKTIEDHWYGASIAGAKSGWVHATVEQEGDRFRSSSTQQISISRGGIVIELEVSSVFIETSDGKPVSVHSVQKAMGQESESTWNFTSNGIEMTSIAGAAPVTKKLPLPTVQWLTPRAVEKYFIEQLEKGATTVTYQTMSPELGTKIITVIMTKMGEEERMVMGEKQTVTLWQTENDVMPIIGTDIYDKSGTKVESIMNAGFGEMRKTLMSKQAAQSPVESLPELMFSMFIEPNLEIPNDPSLQKLTMRAKTKDGKPVEFPSIGVQHVTVNKDGTSTIVIDLANPTTATAEEKNDPQYLASSALCDGTDAMVVALSKQALQALPKDASTLDKALAMRTFVWDYIDEKGLSTAFASASQTARDRAGDCSEHGVLLCGLLRAAGIPSRGVIGVVYVSPEVANLGKTNGAFGWHFWSQALIDGKWVDLDATLQTPFSVGHIASASTSLADESLTSDMVGIMAAIGNLEIEVVNIGN